MSVTIRAVLSGAVLAQGEPETDVIKLEGNWYFRPEAVALDRLQITDKTYTCPYKGTCHWVDHVGADGATIPEVGWVYSNPKPGFDQIKDRYGFYPGSRDKTTEE
jgi:uncharacterized protein (DUF427 family)